MSNDKQKINNLERLFTPIARFLISRSHKIQHALEALKSALVHAASFSLNKSNQKITFSKLSVMTGIHRRDVVRIYREGEVKDSEIDLISKILGVWSLSKKYTNKNGKPKTLIFDGNDSEFAELVYTISTELKPSTILFEMERSGNVKVNGEKVSLKSDVAISKKSLKEAFELLSDDMQDLIDAVSENTYQEQDLKQLHAKTEFDQIPVSALPEIKKWLLNKGAEYHNEVRQYLAKFDQDINPDKKLCNEARTRVAFGTFSIAKNNEEHEDT